MSINIIERAIVPYNETGSSVIFNNQYHMFAPVAGINKVGMAGYNDDFSINTSQIVSISDKFKASGLQYTDVSDLPANIVYALDGVKSPNVVFSGYEHAVQDPTPGNTGTITVKGSLLTTYSNYTNTDNYSMNEILFADGRIWLRELNIVAGVVDTLTEFKISYSKDEVDSYFRTKGDSYTITQINALLDLKVSLAGAETITGKKTFSAGLSTSVAPTVGDDIVNKTYADSKVAKAGVETITGKKTFSAGLDTPVAPAAGHDVVNKTYADSKVPKSAIRSSMSGTPLDSNVLSEKFVNTTYRTKADSWSKADLDTHIGALETRVGNEVLSASLPGNEFGQGTLSGIINTLGSHIDSLQLGFVPRTMRNIITPLRSKNPTDLSTTDSYDELIALSEAGFVPDIPVGQTMTLVDRLNAFVLADQGRAANHTDAVVCVDIQAPDRGRLITYYYWDLGSGDEYEGVPAGWYVADVNMSPDNLTSIGAFTKLLSKTPVGYEEDSTGTRVFAVNGSWKKYSAADLHAIYPTLEYLGLLNLWFIILAPDVDTMNTINNYEPGKSVALVDSSHGMGIDSAISIELLKKVKDVDSGSLIQNTQYCSLNQYHVLSNGLVVLYTDDPFDGEVVIKTGKAYYVSGATEMMAVPMSQVTGLELALDSKVALVDGDIEDTVTTFEEASSRTNIASGESTATLFGKVKKYFTDLKTHAFNDLATSQGMETDKAPTNKLLKESSFARVYREATEIPGITEYPVAIGTVLKAMNDQNLLDTMLVVGLSSAHEEKITGLPRIGGGSQTYGTLVVQVPGTDALRMRVEYSREIGNGDVIKWIGGLDRHDSNNWTVNWKMIIDDTSAQKITGVKEFTASPIVPDPSEPSDAVNKNYVDDGFVKKADIIGDEAPETVKKAEHATTAETANKYNQDDSTAGSIKSKFDSVDSAISGKQPTGNYATLDGENRVNEVAKSADKVNKTLTLPNNKSFDGSADVIFEKADLSLVKADVDLGNVDNTSDEEKPISNPTKAYVNSRTVINYTSFTDVDPSYTNATPIETIVGSMDYNTRLIVAFETSYPTTVYPKYGKYRLYIEKFSSYYAVVNLFDFNKGIEYYKMRSSSSSWGPWLSHTTEENEWLEIEGTEFTETGIIDFYVYVTIGTGVLQNYYTLRMIRPATDIKCNSTCVLTYHNSKVGLYWINFDGQSNYPQQIFQPLDGSAWSYPTFIIRARVQSTTINTTIPKWNE